MFRSFSSPLLQQILAGLNLRSVTTEFIAMTIFIYIGCGTVMSYLAPQNFDYNAESQRDPSYLAHIESTFGVVVPFVFGITVMVLAYAASIMQAGQLNPAVTFGLALTRKISVKHAIAMILAQFFGSVLAVGFLLVTIPNARDSSFGSNSLSSGVSVLNACIGEGFLTFVLMSVVLLTDNNEHKKITSPIAIGFTVFVAHGVLLPIDGCSINPARSFGPAVASGNWTDYWIFFVAPTCGAFIAVVLYYINNKIFPQNQDETQNDKNITNDESVEMVQQELLQEEKKEEEEEGGQQELQVEEKRVPAATPSPTPTPAPTPVRRSEEQSARTPIPIVQSQEERPPAPFPTFILQKNGDIQPDESNRKAQEEQPIQGESGNIEQEGLLQTQILENSQDLELQEEANNQQEAEENSQAKQGVNMLKRISVVYEGEKSQEI